MTLDENESPVTIKVEDFTVQYILKDEKYDMPQPQPLKHYSAKLTILVPSCIVEYIPTYVKNRNVKEDDPEFEDVCPYPYHLPKPTAAKWKKWLKSEYPDYMPTPKDQPNGKKKTQVDTDEIANAVMSCALEDTLIDALEECWDETLGPQYKGGIPTAPDGFYVAGRHIHLLKWSPVVENTEEKTDA